MRNEWEANMALVAKVESKPAAWQKPAPIRAKPSLFQRIIRFFKG